MVDSVALLPGDIVAFKRGSEFSGPVEIPESGTAGDPILFTAYGTGELPKFTNTSAGDMNGNCFRLAGDYLILENLHFHDTPGDPTGFFVMTAIGAVRILHGAEHNIIRDNEFTQCPQGILSAGEHTLITRNYLDGPSEAIWNDGTNSWGPMGIHLNIGNQEVSYNTIKNHLTLDSPYGSDGSAIELDNGNYHKSNIYIHHNYTEGNAGFLESSWSYDWPAESQEVYDLTIAFNVSYDGQSWLYMWAPCHNVKIDNNTVIRSNQFGCPPQADDVALLHVQGGSPYDPSQIDFRNNLFVYDDSTNGAYQGNAGGGALKSSNWYLNYDNYAAVLGGDANKAGDGDPTLVDLAGGDYHLTSQSPLRDQGVNLSDTYSLDYNDQALPQMGAWDVGAMQF
jgi:hypothetical protein